MANVTNTYDRSAPSLLREMEAYQARIEHLAQRHAAEMDVLQGYLYAVQCEWDALPEQERRDTLARRERSNKKEKKDDAR